MAVYDSHARKAHRNRIDSRAVSVAVEKIDYNSETALPEWTVKRLKLQSYIRCFAHVT